MPVLYRRDLATDLPLRQEGWGGASPFMPPLQKAVRWAGAPCVEIFLFGGQIFSYRVTVSCRVDFSSFLKDLDVTVSCTTEHVSHSVDNRWIHIRSHFFTHGAF